MKDSLKPIEADWTRESLQTHGWDPGRYLLASIRQYQKYRIGRDPLSKLLKKWSVLRHRLWQAVCGTDIPLNSQIGGGLLLPHPNGIVIHPEVQIGVNCLIFHQVTLGAGKKPGLPTIGSHVDIGAGAKILGGVIIGDYARIGANAVVLTDVPAGATAVGNPARIIQK